MSITISVGLLSKPQTKHKRVVVTAGSSVIGRSKECDLTINHPSLSRRHCKITEQKDGWWIEDLGSRGGCKIAGQHINAPFCLGSNTQILCGEVVVTVLYNTVAEDKEASSTQTQTVSRHDASRKHKRNAVMPRSSSSLLKSVPQDSMESKSAARRQKIIRPQQGESGEELGKLGTAEIMIGDLNYETKELRVHSDFYDISELSDEH